MRNILLLIAVLFSAGSFAQNNFTLKQPTVTTIHSKGYSDSMPNALVVKPFKGVKIGNNGQGSDLYKSEPDNMIVLKPDSSFHVTIPNAMDVHKLNSIPPALLKQLYEHQNELSSQNNIEEYHFKIIKPSPNKSLMDSMQRKLIPIEPSLQR